LPENTWWDETRAVARRQSRGGEQPSDAADDLAQDLAVAALEHRERPERPGAWLERVGRNARIDRWRVERRRHELRGAIEPPAAPRDPEAEALAHERRSVLRRALAVLPRPLRRAALARFHADLPFEAIAARLGTREVTARTRVHRALERLRERVGGLRVVLAPWPAVQGTVLGVSLVATFARPVPLPLEQPPATPQVGVASPAPRRLVAQVAPSVAPQPTSRRARAVRAVPSEAPAAPPAVQRMDFDEDVVEVGLLRPDGEAVTGETRTVHLSLIELRQSLLPEIAKTLEDL
jgi:RNA polymerase sigma-70 factor (ECF subfamily)